MKRIQSLCGLVMTLLVLLPGCVHVPTYRKQSFKVINHNYDYCGMQDNITVQVKHLTQSDVYALFGVNASSLDAMDIFYVSVYNLDEKDHYVFVKHHHDAVSVPYDKVAWLMKTSSVARISQGIVGGTGLALTTLAVAFSVSIKAGIMTLLFGAPAALVLGILPFFGLSIKSMIMNSRIKEDLQDKVLRDGHIISSGQHYEGLIFIKSAQCRSHFDIVMCAKDTSDKDLTFNVKIPSFC
jgi:hypothetical protein